MNTPVVEYITPDKMAAQKEDYDEDAQEKKMFNISLTNGENNASWDLSDVMISTPVTLSHII